MGEGQPDRAMTRGWRMTGTLMAGNALLLIIAMNTSAAGESATVRGIADGVYTAPQAALGEREYQRSCVGCHMSDLTGSERAPSLAGESFLQRWGGLTLDDLFRRVQSTMPQTSPQSLSEASYLNIVAFLLQANGLPAGAIELKADHNSLKNIRM